MHSSISSVYKHLATAKTEVWGQASPVGSSSKSRWRLGEVPRSWKPKQCW